MSYYNELRERLKERAKPETQFEIFRGIHAEILNRLIKSYGCLEEEVLTTIYMSKFIITGDVTNHAGPQQRLTDDERVEQILINLIESKKFLGVSVSLQERLFLMQLTSQIAWEIDKSFQKNILTSSYPVDVLFCQVIDYLIMPLLSEWFQVLEKYSFDNMDHRWILAEVLASLENDFPLEMMPILQKQINSSRITRNEFFISGWIICQEYLSYLQINEYMPTIIPVSTHLHLMDPMTFAGSIIYRISDSKIYPFDNPLLTTIRGSFPLTEDKVEDIKNLMSLNHPAISPARYLHKNCKFAVRIKNENDKAFQRHLYLFHHTDNELDIGYWLIMLIQSEALNQTQLQYIVQNRFEQITSILDLINKAPLERKFNVEYEDILAVWIKTFVTDLQDETKYLGHMEDYQKSQKYLLMGVSEYSTNSNYHSFVYESIEDNARIAMQFSEVSSNKKFLERVNNILGISDLLYLSGYNLFQFILDSNEKKVKSIKITPSELFFFSEELPEDHLLLLPIYHYNSDSKVHSIVTGVLSNKPPKDIAHIGKVFQSRRNFERTLRFIAENKGQNSLFMVIKERATQAFPFPNLLRNSELKSQWNYCYQILQKKVVEKGLKTKLQKKIDSQTKQKELDRLILLNNVIYFIVKDLIIPYQLFLSEKVMLNAINSLGNSEDNETAQRIVDRKIDKLKERLDQLPNEQKDFISNICLTECEEKLEDFIHRSTLTLKENLGLLNETDLKDLLVSI